MFLGAIPLSIENDLIVGGYVVRHLEVAFKLDTTIASGITQLQVTFPNIEIVRQIVEMNRVTIYDSSIKTHAEMEILSNKISALPYVAYTGYVGTNHADNIPSITNINLDSNTTSDPNTNQTNDTSAAQVGMANSTLYMIVGGILIAGFLLRR